MRNSNLLNILVVNSSVRVSDSHSGKLTDQVVLHYLQDKPGSSVKHINVGQDPYPYIDQHWVIANTTPEKERTEKQKSILSLSDLLIEQLKNADIIIFGCPMYNFSIPASLKNYFDLVCRVGHTFEYGPSGTVGLLTDKKVVVCTTSAGVPSGCENDFVTGYMKQICKFIGLTDCSIISSNCQLSHQDSFGKALLEINKL